MRLSSKPSVIEVLSLLPRVADVMSWDQTDLTLDLRWLQWARPDTIAAIAAYVSLISRIGKLARLHVTPPKNIDVHTYLMRMDFYAALPREANTTFEEWFIRHDSAARFVELTRFRNTGWNEVRQVNGRIYEIIRTHFKVDRSLLWLLPFIFDELLMNVLVHSQGDGYVIAQNYQDRVAICVADNGVGIPTTLRVCPEYSTLSDEALIAKATEEHVSSKLSSKEGFGTGLYYCKKIATRFGGELSIYSKHGFYQAKGGEDTKERLTWEWPGTIVYIELVKKPISNSEYFAIFRGNIPGDILDQMDDDTGT